MKTIYLLFVVFIDQQGYEIMNQVNDTKYNSLLDCKAVKAQYKESDNIKFSAVMNQNILINSRNYIEPILYNKFRI